MIVAGGLGHLPKVMFDTLEMPLLSAFVERWHPETNNFHMPFGEMIILLHDSDFILSCKASGKAVVPKCDGSPSAIVAGLGTALGIRTATEVNETVGWIASNAKQIAMMNLAENPRCPAQRKAMIYLWWVHNSTIFVDKSKTHRHVSYFEILRKLEEAGLYSWAAAALLNLYREIGMASRDEAKQIGGCLPLFRRELLGKEANLIRPFGSRLALERTRIKISCWRSVDNVLITKQPIMLTGCHLVHILIRGYESPC